MLGVTKCRACAPLKNQRLTTKATTLSCLQDLSRATTYTAYNNALPFWTLVKGDMANQKNCRNCGAPNLLDAKFCANCGLDFDYSPLLVSEPRETSPVSQPRKTLPVSQPQKKSRSWLVALVVILLVVGIIGGIALIGNFMTSAGNTNGLSLTAVQIPTPADAASYIGTSNIVAINVTISNNGGPAVKISSDNYYMLDSSGHTWQPWGGTSSSILDSGYSTYMLLYFQITPGATPSQVTYYDGTYNLNCRVNGVAVPQ